MSVSIPSSSSPSPPTTTTMTNIGDRLRAAGDSLIVHPVQRTLRSQKLKTALLAGVVLSTLLAISILASFIAFIALYRAYIPKVGYSAPLELQYGYGKPPFAHLDNLAGRMPIATNQIYDVFLELVLPPSPGNYALGNFMVDLDLRTVSGDSALRATKSASLVWTPELVRTIRTILRLPFYLFLPSSLSTPKQHLRVPLISRKALRSFSTAQIGSAVLSIGRMDAYPVGLENKAIEGCPPLATAAVAAAGRPQELQIYDATLRIVAHLTGIRRFMYYHRITSFVIFSTLFFLTTLSSAFTLWGGLSLYRHHHRLSTTSTQNPRAVSSSNTSESQSKPLRAQDADTHDVLEEAESAARRKEAQRLSGRRMDLAEHEDAQEEEESVLRHIKLEPTESLRPGGGVASRNVIVESAEESSDAESGVLVKAEGDQEELESMPIKAEEGDDDAGTLLGGSATSISGDTLASRTSLGTGKTGSVTSSAATTATRSSSLRKRPSTASMSTKLKEDED